jgi:hypothetical protein
MFCRGIRNPKSNSYIYDINKKKIMKTIAQQLKITDFPFEIRDKNNNRIYYENSNGFWSKIEYDSNNNVIYWEDSYGQIIDNRPKSTPEFTMEELIAKVGFEFKIKK